MTKSKPLTAERLREALAYDPSTGVFTWSVSLSNRTKAGAVAGSPHPDGFVRIRIDGRFHRAHRLAWLYVNGKWPAEEINHVNGNLADNRLSNLREATCAESMGNSRLSVTNTSGFKGVSWHKHSGKWQAQIMVNGVQRHLGSFSTAEAAAQAYDRAAEQHFGEFARTNADMQGVSA